MKRIKTYQQYLITEALGVPAGLLEQAQTLVDQLLNKCRYMFLEQEEKPLVVLAATGLIKSDSATGYQIYQIPILLDGVNFSDFTIEEVQVDLVIRASSYVEDIELDSLAYQLEFDVDTTLSKLVAKIEDKTTIAIYLNCNHDTTWKEIVNFMNTMIDQFYDSFAHELKHAFDYFKKKKQSLEEWADYKASSLVTTGISALDSFFEVIYYLSTIESLTRNTELAMRLKRQGVFYEDFLSFIENDKIYQSLNANRDKWNFNKFIENISRDENLHIYLELNLNTDITLLSAEEKAELAMISVWQEFRRHKEMVIRRLLLSKLASSFTSILVDNETQEKINSIVEQSLKTKSYKDFYNQWFSQFTIGANTTFRKLFKLAANLPKRVKQKNNKRLI